MSQTTEQLLAERKATHGEYFEHAACTQAVMDVAHASRNWTRLPPVIRETVHMWAHKLGRVLTGDPYRKDHYDDVSGYATLVSQRINDDETGLKPWPPADGGAQAAVVATPFAPAPVTGEALADEESLGTEALTTDRVRDALRHAFNCSGVDGLLGRSDTIMAEGTMMYVPLTTQPLGRLTTRGELYGLLSVGTRLSGLNAAFDAKKGEGQGALIDVLMPHVLSHLRDQTSVQVVQRLEEYVASAYSPFYDQLARDTSLPRHEVKRRFLAAMYDPAGALAARLPLSETPEPSSVGSLRDTLTRELRLGAADDAFLREVIRNHRGMSYSDLSKSVLDTVRQKHCCSYRGSTERFVAHVTLLARAMLDARVRMI